MSLYATTNIGTTRSSLDTQTLISITRKYIEYIIICRQQTERPIFSHSKARVACLGVYLNKNIYLVHNYKPTTLYVVSKVWNASLIHMRREDD